MAFMNKAELEEKAEKYGLDLDGLSWQQKQKAVIEAMAAAGDSQPSIKPKPDPHANDDARDARIRQLEKQLESARARARAVPQVPVVFDLGKNEPAPRIEDYDNAILVASPEQRPTQFQRKKYYEIVGTEKQTEDVYLGVGNQSPFKADEDGTRSATYKVRDTGRPVTAESTMPKYSCLLTYRPTKDLCAVAEYQGHRGYLWTHHRLPNICAMLRQMGAYEEYKHLWQDAPNRLFYLGGLLCCDISFTESAMSRIQRELAKRDKEE